MWVNRRIKNIDQKGRWKGLFAKMMGGRDWISRWGLKRVTDLSYLNSKGTVITLIKPI